MNNETAKDIADYFTCYHDFCNIFLTKNTDRCELFGDYFAREKFGLPQLPTEPWVGTGWLENFRSGSSISGVFSKFEAAIPGFISERKKRGADAIEIHAVFPVGCNADNWLISNDSPEIQVRFVKGE